MTDSYPHQRNQGERTDTGRLIAATREEACGKTRGLLVGIFIGIPLVGLAIWGLVAADTATNTPGTSNASVWSTDIAGPLSLYSTCAQLSSATTDERHDFDEVWPEVADEADTNCVAQPNWTITQAITPPAIEQDGS